MLQEAQASGSRGPWRVAATDMNLMDRRSTLLYRGAEEAAAEVIRDFEERSPELVGEGPRPAVATGLASLLFDIRQDFYAAGFIVEGASEAESGAADVSPLRVVEQAREPAMILPAPTDTDGLLTFFDETVDAELELMDSDLGQRRAVVQPLLDATYENTLRALEGRVLGLGVEPMVQMLIESDAVLPGFEITLDMTDTNVFSFRNGRFILGRAGAEAILIASGVPEFLGDRVTPEFLEFFGLDPDTDPRTFGGDNVEDRDDAQTAIENSLMVVLQRAAQRGHPLATRMFPDQSALWAPVRGRIEAIPEAAETTRGIEQLAGLLFGEVGAYGVLGELGAQETEKETLGAAAYENMRRPIGAFVQANRDVAVATGLVDVKDLASFRVWVENWYSLSLDQRLQLCGDEAHTPNQTDDAPATPARGPRRMSGLYDTRRSLRADLVRQARDARDARDDETRAALEAAAEAINTGPTETMEGFILVLGAHRDPIGEFIARHADTMFESERYEGVAQALQTIAEARAAARRGESIPDDVFESAVQAVELLTEIENDSAELLGQEPDPGLLIGLELHWREISNAPRAPASNVDTDTVGSADASSAAAGSVSPSTIWVQGVTREEFEARAASVLSVSVDAGLIDLEFVETAQLFMVAQEALASLAEGRPPNPVGLDLDAVWLIGDRLGHEPLPELFPWDQWGVPNRPSSSSRRRPTLSRTWKVSMCFLAWWGLPCSDHISIRKPSCP